jgi:hypothetical protein
MIATSATNAGIKQLAQKIPPRLSIEKVEL